MEAIKPLRMLVEQAADAFEPGVHFELTIEQVVAEWAAIERIACAAKLRAAARVEELGLDAESTVADASGVTTSQARKQTRAARKARRTVATRDAFEKGRLSPTQAEAIADAVEANPGAEQSLLDLAASGSASDVLSECDRVKRDALDADGSLAAQQREARSFRSWTDGLGMRCFAGRVGPVEGAKLVAEMERRADRMFREQVRAGSAVDTMDQRMADALMEILGESGGGSASGRRSRGPRTKVQLLVTKAAVDRGRLRPGEKCETADGRPIPMGAVDAALCDPDTEVQEVHFTGVNVTEIRSYGRYIPERLRDALSAQGRCCSVNGCGRTKGLHRDHRDEMRDGGATEAANLGWLCAYHHDLKTRRLFRFVIDEHGMKHWEPTPRGRSA